MKLIIEPSNEHEAQTLERQEYVFDQIAITGYTAREALKEPFYLILYESDQNKRESGYQLIGMLTSLIERIRHELRQS